MYLNWLLETNPVPILWTSNNLYEIDAALLRRMTLAIELKQPPGSAAGAHSAAAFGACRPGA